MALSILSELILQCFEVLFIKFKDSENYYKGVEHELTMCVIATYYNCVQNNYFHMKNFVEIVSSISKLDDFVMTKLNCKLRV